MVLNKKYIDQVYNFKGEWDMPSKCGLKIVRKPDETIVILSELYVDNPGTSVTVGGNLVANQVCNEFNIDNTKVRFILHNPDIGSKHEYFKEEFNYINFDLENNIFKNQKWLKVSKEEVDQLIND